MSLICVFWLSDIGAMFALMQWLKWQSVAGGAQAEAP